MIKMITILFLIGLISGQNSSKYCNLCVNHIACGNSGNFASTCPADRKLVVLSESDMNNILKAHNSLRNKIASGNVQV